MLPLLCVVISFSVAEGRLHPFTAFRPQGYGHLPPLDEGKGPDVSATLHLTRMKAKSDLCEGRNDILAVTLPVPIVGDVEPEAFRLRACPPEELGDDPDNGVFDMKQWGGSAEDCDPLLLVPKCARLQLHDDPHERRTVLLFGQFVEYPEYDQLTTNMLVDFTLDSVTFLVDGKQVKEYGTHRAGQAFVQTIDQDPEEPLGIFDGPFLADISLLDLSAPLNTAAADPIGCAALHPSATYAVRLLFASAVHERAADGGLAPFGTNATAAAALFSLHTGINGQYPSPDRIVGVAGVRGGSAVDVCVQGAWWGRWGPQVETVFINCTPNAPLSPNGSPCEAPIKAFLRSEEDERAGRDPTAFTASHTIEICLSSPEKCPGASGAAGGVGDSTAAGSRPVAMGEGVSLDEAVSELTVVEDLATETDAVQHCCR